MIRLIRHNQQAPLTWSHYLISGQLIVASERIQSLHEFEIDEVSNENNNLNLKSIVTYDYETLTKANAQCVCQEHVIFNNKESEVSFFRPNLGGGHQLAQIDIDNEPACLLDLENEVIVILNQQPFTSNFNIELITGPALILLLAEKSIFSLHASAVSMTLPSLKNVNVAFIAESGVGKSTMSLNQAENWTRCADDIVPIVINGQSITMSNYPQLKLNNKKINFKNNSLNYIFNLNCNLSDEVSIERMSPIEGVLSIVRHTVAAKFFNAQLLQNQLKFAQALVESIDVYRLSYPREIDQLPLLQKQIIHYLAS